MLSAALRFRLLPLTQRRPCVGSARAQCADGGQAGLPLHRDGSLLSFNVLLSRPDAFRGGGTRFPHLARRDDEVTADDDACAFADADGVVRPAQGDAVVHSGSALHAGEAVTAGTRLLLVGFVDSARPRGAPRRCCEAPA